MRLTTLALLLGVLATTGCGANGSAKIRMPGKNPYEITMMRQSEGPIVELKLCLEPGSAPGIMNEQTMAGFTKWMRSIFWEVAVGAPDCDLAVKSDFGPTTRDLYFRELKTGKELLSAHTSGGSLYSTQARVAEELFKLFRKDPTLKAIARRSGKLLTPSAASTAAAGPAATPASVTSGVTREDLARIVADAMKSAQAPAAVAAPAPLRDLSAEPSYRNPERPDDLAVIIGIEEYADAPKATYAERDAEAFRAHARALGVPDRNIAFLKGSRAGKASFEKNLEQWLPRLAKPESRVYFFFSGHGAPDIKTGQAYLVPWDGDPNFLETTAYPVKRLYEKLAALPAKQVFVAMDSCFSGAGGRSLVASGARPLVGKVDAGQAGRVTALAASAVNEISGSIDSQQHGAFTYYLLQGLNGAAKDGNGRVTIKGLHAYLTPLVQDEARRLNRDQTPQLLGGDSDLILR